MGRAAHYYIMIVGSHTVCARGVVVVMAAATSTSWSSSEFPFSCFSYTCDPPGGKDVYDNLNVLNYKSFVLIFIAAFSKMYDNNTS